MAEAPQKGKSPLGMPFPFYKALPEREYGDLLRTVTERRKVDQTGVVYIEQMPMYTAALPYHWQQFPDAMNGFMRTELVEQGIKRKMEKAHLINWSSGLSKLDPLVTTGDGNCLLHAAALYMWGIEDTDLILRNSLSENLNKGSFADVHMQRWKNERAVTDQAHLPDFRYNTVEWDEEFAMVKSMAIPTPGPGHQDLPYPSLEEFHIYALANILRRPIMVLAQDKVRSARGASLQPLSVSGLYLPLHWDPSLCCNSPIVLGFENNHFFPLMHTAPEEAKYEGDLLVPLIINTPDGMGFMKVHFMLPREEQEVVARKYLDVDSIIHCVSDKETAIGIPGAKLSARSLGQGLSVWDAYFQMAEQNLRVYYEKEYNPDGAGTVREQEESAQVEVRGLPERDIPGHQYLPSVAGGLPAASKPSNRGQGQCRTAGCPYQRSIATGEVCVECFNKGDRQKCRSSDCLNKADVGLEGFCKVCHEGNKFLQQESSPPPLDKSLSGGSSSGSSPTNDQFGEGDVNSLAVNTFTSGFEKCIMPECQLTGNPNTSDMCQGCYRSSMELQRELEDAMHPMSAKSEADEFVVVNKKGEEEPKREKMQDRRAALDRRAELMEKHGLSVGTRNKKPLPSDRTQSAAAVVRQRDPQPLRNDPPSERSRSSGQPVQKITVQKDLCATAGCSGVRLRDRDLCKGCTDKKKQPAHRGDESPGDDRIHPARKMEQSRHLEPYEKFASAPVPQPRQASPWQPEAHRMDSDPSRRPDMGYNKQGYRPPQRQYPGHDQGPPRAGYSTERAGSGNQEMGFGPHSHGQPQYPGQDQPVRRCKIKRCGQPSAPPDYKYCRDCLVDIEEDYITQKAAQMLQEKQYNLARPGPAQQNITHDPAVGQRNPGMRAPERGGEDRNMDMTRQLDRQIRDQFHRQDRSDAIPAQPAAPPRRPVVEKRGPCARPKGCPDTMYGAPETGGMCSKCWKEVGAKKQGQDGEEFAGVTANPMVREGHYQAPRGRDGGYQNYGERVTQKEHVYEEIEEHCAQPECERPAAENVERFCEQCHENYRALFSDYRQINTA